MLSYLDRIIFPDRCEVIEVIPSQRYVYPIFKNGKSSLDFAIIENNWRIRLNDQIKKINSIDVILRNPKERLVSGINTFIQHTLRDNPGLDKRTVHWFAQNYLYLNRHYCSQFIWLVNLARYLNSDAKLNFLSMNDLGTITKFDEKPYGIEQADETLIAQVNQIKNNEMYQRIDMIIFGCIGQSLTFGQLLQHIKNSDVEAYEYVIGYAQQILKSTYALS
jgi:hypothetical protein